MNHGDLHEFWTPSGVRMRPRFRRGGDLNWLFLPGGPGIGSQSLNELVDAIQVPGTSWMVDLPGDGSNIDPPGAAENPYEKWPQVVVEAAQAVPNPVFVGHSTGGMHLLSTPALEELLVGLALVSTAPDATWLPAFVEMTRRHRLPAVDEAATVYEADRTDENLREVAVLSAGWNFGNETMGAGVELLGRMPYNSAAMSWSAQNFDSTYVSTWWPVDIPTLILSGSDDRVVTQTIWDEPRFQGHNVVRRIIDGGAHFPWIERPEATREAFVKLVKKIISRPSHGT